MWWFCNWSDYGVLVRPTLPEWSEGGQDQIMLRMLDTDNIRVISSILGQSIALDHYAKKVGNIAMSYSLLSWALLLVQPIEYTMHEGHWPILLNHHYHPCKNKLFVHSCVILHLVWKDLLDSPLVSFFSYIGPSPVQLSLLGEGGVSTGVQDRRSPKITGSYWWRPRFQAEGIEKHSGANVASLSCQISSARSIEILVVWETNLEYESKVH